VQACTSFSTHTCSFGLRHLHAVWRGSLALGVVPAVAVFIWRLKMDEPDRYKKDSMKRTKIPYLLIIRRYGVRLAAISVTWFAFHRILLECQIEALFLCFNRFIYDFIV
jgi:hypothetical protein